MTKLNPRTFGVVLSTTVVMIYVLCVLFWYSFTGSAIQFLNALFHGMDFRKIYTAAPFVPGSFLYSLLCLGYGLTRWARSTQPSVTCCS